MFNEDVILANLARKWKRKKGHAKDKKKSERTDIKFKCKGSTKKRKNDHGKCGDDCLVESDHSIEDDSYEEAKNSWALDKSLRLYTKNDEKVIQALVDACKGNENDFAPFRSRRKKGSN